MGDSSEALRSVALAHFARDGFAGASLQHIAADAGRSKSSILYHFESKEALFDAAMRPALTALRALVDSARSLRSGADRDGFLDRYVDFIFTHRLAVTVMVNFGPALTGMPVVQEADALVRRLTRLLDARPGSDAPATDRLDLDSLRFGFGLAGAVYVLAASDRWHDGDVAPDDLRAAVRAVLAELTTPGQGIAAPACAPELLGQAC